LDNYHEANPWAQPSRLISQEDNSDIRRSDNARNGENPLNDLHGANPGVQQHLIPHEEDNIAESWDIIQNLNHREASREPVKNRRNMPPGPTEGRKSRYIPTTSTEQHPIEHAPIRAGSHPEPEFDMDWLTKEFQTLSPEMQRYISRSQR